MFCLLYETNIVGFSFQVLCPRCDLGTGYQRSRTKKVKEASQTSKRSSSKLESLCDIERALSETKDTASAVSVAVYPQPTFCFHIIMKH